MATLSLRMRDDLKRKLQALAEGQGVSLNNYLNSIAAACVAQEEAMRFFRNRLHDVDRGILHKRVLKFIKKSRRGADPSPEELSRLTGRKD